MHAKHFQEIPNLGDDAFWNGTDLWFLNGTNPGHHFGKLST